MLMEAQEVSAGMWFADRDGLHEVDGMQVAHGWAHIGTRAGVMVVPKQKLLFVLGGDA